MNTHTLEEIKDLSWDLFATTGDIEMFLLYKTSQDLRDNAQDNPENYHGRTYPKEY